MSSQVEQPLSPYELLLSKSDQSNVITSPTTSTNVATVAALNYGALTGGSANDSKADVPSDDDFNEGEEGEFGFA